MRRNLNHAKVSKKQLCEVNHAEQRHSAARAGARRPGHWVHVSESPRHVRVFFGGETIANSKRVKLVREAEVLPAYYFPKEDVRTELFVAERHNTSCPQKARSIVLVDSTGNKSAENAAWSYLTRYSRRRIKDISPLIGPNGQVDGGR